VVPDRLVAPEWRQHLQEYCQLEETRGDGSCIEPDMNQGNRVTINLKANTVSFVVNHCDLIRPYMGLLTKMRDDLRRSFGEYRATFAQAPAFRLSSDLVPAIFRPFSSNVAYVTPEAVVPCVSGLLDVGTVEVPGTAPCARGAGDEAGAGTGACDADAEVVRFARETGIEKALQWVQENVLSYWVGAGCRIRLLPPHDEGPTFVALNIRDRSDRTAFKETRRRFLEALRSSGHSEMYGILCISQHRQ